MNTNIEGMPTLEGLGQIIDAWRDSTAYIIPITSDQGKKLGNNGDDLMYEVFLRILEEFGIKQTPNRDTADVLIVPPSGSLLEIYTFPSVLKRRLLGAEHKPLVIFPSSAYFPTLDPSLIFQGRLAETIWILRENTSYEHLTNQWGAQLKAAKVKLELDHDVVASGHKFVHTIIGRPDQVLGLFPVTKAGRPLIAGRLDVEGQKLKPAGGAASGHGTGNHLKKWLAKLIPYGRLYTALARASRQKEMDQAARTLVSKVGAHCSYSGDLMAGQRVDASSPQLATFSEYKVMVSSASVVITNRLHVGLPAAILGKEVFFVEAGYHKLGGVYEQSLRAMPNVSFIKA